MYTCRNVDEVTLGHHGYRKGGTSQSSCKALIFCLVSFSIRFASDSRACISANSCLRSFRQASDGSLLSFSLAFIEDITSWPTFQGILYASYQFQFPSPYSQIFCHSHIIRVTRSRFHNFLLEHMNMLYRRSIIRLYFLVFRTRSTLESHFSISESETIFYPFFYLPCQFFDSLIRFFQSHMDIRVDLSQMI